MDAHTTLSYMAEAFNLPDFGFNHDGHAEVVLNDEFSVYISKIDESWIEISLFLPDLDIQNADFLRIMLESNSPGNSPFGRMAIDPQNNKALYCERWDLHNFSKEILYEYLKKFISQVLLWRKQGINNAIRKTNKLEIKSDRGLISERKKRTPKQGFLH